MEFALIDQAVRLLRSGRLVAFPTETVYGLGADATQAGAVQQIFAAKGRPGTNPLIVHIASAGIARRYASSFPSAAEALAERFWPGPLTLVLPRADVVVPAVSAGLDTVGLRCPRHPLALELLRRFDGAVAAPSANRSNRVSPTTAEHVRQELGDRVDLILDGGPCEVGIESTVLTLCTPVPTILRPGSITPDEIRGVIGETAVRPAVLASPVAAASPGQHLIHYAPDAPCFSYVDAKQVASYQSRLPGASLILLAITPTAAAPGHHHVVSMPADPVDYARHLYAALRAADTRRPDAILIELPPNKPRWMAVHDRLRRASTPLE